MTTYFSDTALSKLIGFTLEYPDLETGGELYGIFDEKGNPIVSYISGPGPNALHQYAAFKQDMDFYRQERDFNHSEKRLSLIGMWHSHHKIPLHEPSSGDINTLSRNLKNLTRNFLLIICCINEKGKVEGYAYVFDKNADYERTELNNTLKYPQR